ncbi:adenylate kinase [Opitutaceae bacterium TAV4]|nr:adenylate kinase [Opitutaceae bacterium TAV4]RRK00224.1 adenylate kinase [Opitutaceae bacterium TAV3]
MSESSSPFFHEALGPKPRLLILDQAVPVWLSDRLAEKTRSLNIEHVSPAELMRQEICRQSPLGQTAARELRQRNRLGDATTLALLRRWFWTRKPDAGFVLTDFPATLLQARVFDEWLETRDETLDAVIATRSAASSDQNEEAQRLLLHEYYRTHGLLRLFAEDGQSVETHLAAA